MPATSTERPLALAWFLVAAGVIGFAAAFSLTIDKLISLEDPSAQLSCNFSALVGCSTNLASWQGSLFGFPNPLLGIAGWAITVTVGAALLARARLDRWFWVFFNVGLLGALSLVIFFITQSIYVLGVLCPWCMVTWLVVIPTFLAVTLYNLSVGHIPVPASLRRGAGAAYRWVPLISLACYVVVFILAQAQLDVLNRL